VAASPDGTWAVSAGSGGLAFQWQVDAATGRWSSPEPLSGHRGDILDVEIAPTGRELITVAADLTAIRWDMDAAADRTGPALTDEPEQWLRAVCAVVGRDLSAREWERFLPDRPYAATCTDLL
jgi:WD40 repeat protein